MQILGADQLMNTVAKILQMNEQKYFDYNNKKIMIKIIMHKFDLAPNKCKANSETLLMHIDER